MIRIIPISLFLCLLGTGFFSSCKEKEEYPDTPTIKFESFTRLYNAAYGIYDRGVLKISFTDGDGDIGLNQGETAPPYKYNLFINFMEVQNKDTIDVDLLSYNPNTQQYDTINHNARVPLLTPEGDVKAIEGTIEDTLFIYDFNSTFDTLLFEVYLLDRALHKSNVILTPLIIRK